jgi:2-iminobutanoate/2-iminopropanoate deaminase
MIKKQIIRTDKAPKAIGPYTVANRIGNLIFASGQLGLDPENNELVPGGVEEQTRQSLTNLKNILEAAGSSLSQVVKTTVFLADMADFVRMNNIYGEFFSDNPPARSTVQVAALPRNALIEIDLIAYVAES